MTWTKLSDNYADRLEDLELTPTACWLHTAALIYCNRVGSDGRLPFSKIGKVASVPAADLYVAELEQQGLWTRLDGDGAWQVDWTDQEPAEDVRRRREGANDRQRATEKAAASKIATDARAAERRITAAADQAVIRAVEGERAALELERLAAYRDVPAAVLMGLAAREFAGKIETIEHLNLTPDLLGTLLADLAGAATRHLDAGTPAEA